jgi:hypothetical protein
MPRIDREGNAVFHPAELPSDYQSMPHPDDNPFIREIQPMKQSRRKCIVCEESFTLLGEYDPENPAHDRCDSCILKMPHDPGQRYPDKTVQIAGMDSGGSLVGDGE